MMLASPVAPAADSAEPVDSVAGVRAALASLEASGDISGAAAVALRGAGRFPGDGGLVREAVRLLLLSGQNRLAAEFLTARAEGKLSADRHFLLGQVREQSGEEGPALQAYLSARQQGMTGPELDAALKRLADRALKVENLWLLPPPGWQRGADRLTRLDEPLTLMIQSQTSTDLKAVVMSRIRDGMPPDMFTDAAMMQREALARQRQDFLRVSAATGQPAWPDDPDLRWRPLTDAKGGLLAVASVSAGQVRTALAVLAMRQGPRIYTLSLMGGASTESLEKALMTFRDGLIWQTPEVTP